MSSILNRTCKNCGKKFHACSSCNILYDWEYDYCSRECYTASDEYNENKYKMEKFIKSLNPEQKKYFKYIVEDLSEENLLDYASSFLQDVK